MAIFNPWIRFEAVDAVPLGSGEPRFTGRLWISHPGTWAGVRLTLPDESVVTLVSGYGLFDDRHPTEKGLVYSTTAVNRMLSDLTPLIDSDAGRRMVIAGTGLIADVLSDGATADDEAIQASSKDDVSMRGTDAT